MPPVTGTPMHLTLRLFDLSGAQVALLPMAGSIECQEVLNEPGYGTLRYPAGGSGAADLISMLDSTGGFVAAQINGEEVFRFSIEDDEDEQADVSDGRFITVGGPGMLSVLTRGVVLPPGGIGSTTTVHSFTGATPGGVLIGLLGTIQGAGYLTGLTVSFNQTHDSAGQPWTKTLDKDYDAGQDMLSVVSELCELGFIDVRTQGDVLHAYNADTFLGAATSVRFRRAHVQSAPRKRSRKELHTDLLVMGDNGTNMVRSNASARAAYGPRLGFLGQNNTPTVSMLQYVGDEMLNVYARPQTSYTHVLKVEHPTCPRPHVDFTIGNKVRSDLVRVGGTHPPLRLRSIAYTLDQAGLTRVSVELNDRFRQPNVILRRKLDQIVPGVDSGGSPVVVGGGGGFGASLWVGPDDPGDGYDFWFDTDEPA